MENTITGCGVISGDRDEIRSLYKQSGIDSEEQLDNLVGKEPFMKTLKQLIQNQTVKPFDIAYISHLVSKSLFNLEKGWGTDKSIALATWESFTSELKLRFGSTFGSILGWPADLIDQFVDYYLPTIPRLVDDTNNLFWIIIDDYIP